MYLVRLCWSITRCQSMVCYYYRLSPHLSVVYEWKKYDKLCKFQHIYKAFSSFECLSFFLFIIFCLSHCLIRGVMCAAYLWRFANCLPLQFNGKTFKNKSKSIQMQFHYYINNIFTYHWIVRNLLLAIRKKTDGFERWLKLNSFFFLFIQCLIQHFIPIIFFSVIVD